MASWVDDMNIFLPYEDDFQKSVESLDDRRLVKQILECKVLLDIALGQREGYSHHPVAVHYKDSPAFIALYGTCACAEYWHRFRKVHQYTLDFNLAPCDYREPYEPFYAEYPRTDSRCIRTTENVSELFQQKLVRKWETDRIEPKWTNRRMPEFYRRNTK